MTDSSENERPSRHFIEVEIDRDLAEGRVQSVHTRFPPEPNGYLHLGHAKAICVDFGLATQYGGLCNLRFDDTNPSKEETRFVEAIQEDVRWLGFDWGERQYYASDFFEQLYGFAEDLIRAGDAYVDDLPVAEIRSQRGGPGVPGTESPFRARSPEENLQLFRAMRAGEFPEGHCVLRAKIDMAHANLLMRDPVLYRILKAPHHRTGDAWCIYPTYDMAHGQCDAFEGVTHSLCSLEFENHRPLYEWLVQRLDVAARPRQIEFSRLNVTHTVLSKRRLVELVEEGHVDGWDDPRLPTLQGMRRRGYPAEAIRAFCARVGVTKVTSTAELSWLEDAVRSELNRTAPRRMAVQAPLRVVLTSIGEDEGIRCEAVDNPEDPSGATRPVELRREVLIERDDFLEDAPRKFFRLRPGGSVRLRYGPVITCDEVIKDDEGAVVELRCSHDPRTFGGVTPEGEKKVKGIIHWVAADTAVETALWSFEPLFMDPNPAALEDWRQDLNPTSRVEGTLWVEPAAAEGAPGETFQFERLGYYRADPAAESLRFLRTVTLRDTWAKVQGK